MKFFLPIALCLLFLFCACESKPTPKEDEGIWTIMSVNCPNVWIRKDGREKAVQFHFRPGITLPTPRRMKKCKEMVRPGGTAIFGEKVDQISFFLPEEDPSEK